MYLCFSPEREQKVQKNATGLEIRIRYHKNHNRSSCSTWWYNCLHLVKWLQGFRQFDVTKVQRVYLMAAVEAHKLLQCEMMHMVYCLKGRTREQENEEWNNNNNNKEMITCKEEEEEEGR